MSVVIEIKEPKKEPSLEASMAFERSKMLKSDEMMGIYKQMSAEREERMKLQASLAALSERVLIVETENKKLRDHQYIFANVITKPSMVTFCQTVENSWDYLFRPARFEARKSEMVRKNSRRLQEVKDFAEHVKGMSVCV